MPMRTVTLRFGERLWELVQEAAQADGLSASQFIREAALGRVIYDQARRGANRDYERALADIRELLSTSDG